MAGRLRYYSAHTISFIKVSGKCVCVWGVCVWGGCCGLEAEFTASTKLSGKVIGIMQCDIITSLSAIISAFFK